MQPGGTRRRSGEALRKAKDNAVCCTQVRALGLSGTTQ